MIKHQKTLFIAAAFLAACQDNVTTDLTSRQENEPNLTEIITDYSITPEEALANLQDFLESEKSETRGIPERKVSAIYPVRVSNRVTRSTGSADGNDNILYVANFEDSSGYAILAADSRISDKVIAVTESGYLSEDVMGATAAAIASNQDRPIINQYPLDGPGFFTDPRYGDEVFINPNTVDFYIKEKDDTLVGNYEYDDEYTTNTNSQNSEISSEGSFIEEYTSSLCIGYALNEINGGDRDGNDDDDEASDESDPIENPPGDDHLPDTRVVNSVSDWSNVRFKSPILAAYSTWTQNDPFNYFCPTRMSFIQFWKKPKKAPAGCFPLAIAKILTHFSKPSIFTYNNVTVNWDGLKSKGFYDVDIASVATLLRGIGAACDSWYFYEGTFTFPFEVTAFLKRIGYSNASDNSYSFERVTGMIDNDKPVIIYGLPGIDITSAHSWNIDGYKVKQRSLTKKVYKNGSLVSSTETIESVNMVHCDFGWRGEGNGYFVSGVFKLNDPNVERDKGCETNKKTKYNTIRLITYDKP